MNYFPCPSGKKGKIRRPQKYLYYSVTTHTIKIWDWLYETENGSVYICATASMSHHPNRKCFMFYHTVQCYIPICFFPAPQWPYLLTNKHLLQLKSTQFLLLLSEWKKKKSGEKKVLLKSRKMSLKNNSW